jgi:hypothetical protein
MRVYKGFNGVSFDFGGSSIFGRSGDLSDWPGDLVPGPWGSIPGPGRGVCGGFGGGPGGGPEPYTKYVPYLILGNLFCAMSLVFMSVPSRERVPGPFDCPRSGLCRPRLDLDIASSDGLHCSQHCSPFCVLQISTQF